MVLLSLLIIAVVVLVKIFNSPKEKYVRSVSGGKTPEQKKTIRYFVETLFGKWSSDEEYENYLESLLDREGSKAHAMIKLGIDEEEVHEIEPVMMEGYLFDNTAYQKRRKKDGKWVSSGFELSWLFFGESQVYIYTKTIYTDETRAKEDTMEYFYKDITAFKTGSENVDIYDKITNKHDYVNTTNFQVVVPGDSKMIAVRDAGTLEHSIQGMKQLLREKKS